MKKSTMEKRLSHKTPKSPRMTGGSGGGGSGGVSYSSVLFLVSFAVLFLLSLTSGQTTPDLCSCDGVPCAKNLTASDCNGRVIAREDCKCCFVCAKQLTDECNLKELPCDADFGLVCGLDNRCQAATPCSDDTSCSSDKFCVGGSCADPCRVLPNVCPKENKNGVCVVRNHRAMCLEEQAAEGEKQCETTEGRKVESGKSIYMDKCEQKCSCDKNGHLSCDKVENAPVCDKGFIPMSRITGEMSELCKILISNDDLFDGCCVPQKCLNATTQHDKHDEFSDVNANVATSKGSRGFKLTESQNNLEDSEDDKPKQREMLLTEGERTVAVPSSSSPVASGSSSSESQEEEGGEATTPYNDLPTEKSGSAEAGDKSLTESSSSSSGGKNLTAEGVSHKMIMQVRVLKRTTHSAVIELPKNDKEAMLSIALTAQVSQQRQQSPGSTEEEEGEDDDDHHHDVWKVHRIPPGLPQITLSDLQPNTSYTLKYSMGQSGENFPIVQFITDGDQDEKKEMLTSGKVNTQTEKVEAAAAPAAEEEIDAEATTPSPMIEHEKLSSNDVNNNQNSNDSSTHHHGDGCLYNGTSYTTGQVVMEGCDQRCECMKDGQMTCLERCSIPFFKKGHFAHDPLCFEEPSGVDPCCVIVACARSSHPAGEPRVLKLNPCEAKLPCGPNSECRFEVSPSGMQSEQDNQETATLCVCKDGHFGDPYNETVGCQPGPNTATAISPVTDNNKSAPATPAKVDGCIFNNKTYEFGAEHFDGCSYKCHCETSGEFLCRPRCNYRSDEEKEIPKECEVKKDPSDPMCCEMLVCDGEPLESGKEKAADVPTDGCVYKNQTYARDKKFYDGCEQQCMCFSNGDVTCQPRCPPAGPNANDDCITLPDPTDKCCTVTVCDPQTQEKLAISDVMKAANESAARAAAMEHSTEIPILLPKARSDDSPTTESSSSSSPTTSTTTTTAAPKTSSSAEDSSSSTSMEKTSPSSSVAKISMIIPLNDTSVMVTIRLSEKALSQLDDQMVKIYYSTDMTSWLELEARIKDLYVEGSDEIHTVINGLVQGKEYFFKAKINGSETNTVSGFTRPPKMINGSSSSEEFEMGSHEMISGEEGDHDHSGQMSSSGEDHHGGGTMCKYKEGHFNVGQEFFAGCENYCSCEEGGMLKCVPIECPTDLGLELLDPNCLRWEPVTESFHREPPHCCPEMRCVQNSTCEIDGGFVFKNYEEIPQKFTGCDKRCFCENGNITCDQLCPTMPEKPPAHLPCPPEMAMPVTIPPNECCYTWVCRTQSNVTDGPTSLLHHLLNQTLTQQTLHDMTNLTLNGTFNPYPHQHDDDQLVPPSTGNQPSFVPLNQINREQLEDLLHQLSTITGDGGHPQHGHHHPGDIRPIVPQGTYLSVKDSEEVQELEKAGAKVIEQAEDGSYVVFVPSSSAPPHGHNNHNNPIPIFPHPEILAGHAGPPGFPFVPQYDSHGPSHGLGQTDQLGNVMIRALNESTLQIDFTVSPVLVGLHGVVEVLYTKDFLIKSNPDQWERQVFQQAEDLIDNSHLQLFLTGLEPDTEYHLKIQVIMRDIQNAPASRILMIRTPIQAIPTTTLPPEIIVDPEVKLVDVARNTVKISWRKFTDLESSLIDGVQIKYRAEQDQVYSTTPLIHRSITNYELTNLQPGQPYEIDLLFIPFTNQTTELRSEKPIHIKTLPEEDPYSFTIAVESGKVTESSAELIWDGVPYPEDKYVNIYQVIYQSDSQKEQKSTFKVAKREHDKKAVINDLKPGTRYRVWVEAFLTNGKKKRTNVIDVLTKAGQLPTPDRASQDKLLEDNARSQESVAEAGSYYGALVALAIIAALSIMGIIVLLMILIRKQNQAKAPINDKRSESSYDNPSFKNYDLESNGHSKPGDT